MEQIYGQTHTVNGVIDPRSETQLAICGVRFLSTHVEQYAPTCSWCQRKSEEMRGTWRHVSAAKMNKLNRDTLDATRQSLRRAENE